MPLNHDVQKTLDDLLLSNLVLKADIQALLDIAAELAQRLPASAHGDLDVGAIFAQHHVAALQKTLEEFEDAGQSGFAAQLQQRLDETRKRLGQCE